MPRWTGTSARQLTAKSTSFGKHEIRPHSPQEIGIEQSFLVFGRALAHDGLVGGETETFTIEIENPPGSPVDRNRQLDLA
ncbi:hypothetical protein BHE97_02935 [Aeromicrobium sp. PE09-221]|nr:hypothetical protein BHE97_02935 [Aeromicrobium sp. PE09-221]